MSSELGYMEYVADQMSDAGKITYRKMFGEYGVYCNGKIVALVCDNQLFVKPTERGKSFIGQITEAPPYPGAKPYLLIQEQCDDREWLSELIRRTHDELPPPKPKKKSKKK